jgi:hypothetical protein
VRLRRQSGVLGQREATAMNVAAALAALAGAGRLVGGRQVAAVADGHSKQPVT